MSGLAAFLCILFAKQSWNSYSVCSFDMVKLMWLILSPGKNYRHMLGGFGGTVWRYESFEWACKRKTLLLTTEISLKTTLCWINLIKIRYGRLWETGYMEMMRRRGGFAWFSRKSHCIISAWFHKMKLQADFMNLQIIILSWWSVYVSDCIERNEETVWPEFWKSDYDMNFGIGSIRFVRLNYSNAIINPTNTGVFM